MKSVFTLNAYIDRMLETAKYDTAKLVNAVQASLNSATATEGDAKRSAVRLTGATINGSKVKGAGFKFNESLPIAYAGKTDAPARFARWHDSMARHFKVCGEPSGELTIDVLPASDKAWLDDKFSLTAKPATAKRNGDVKSVPSPTVPA